MRKPCLPLRALFLLALAAAAAGCTTIRTETTTYWRSAPDAAGGTSRTFYAAFLDQDCVEVQGYWYCGSGDAAFVQCQLNASTNNLACSRATDAERFLNE